MSVPDPLMREEAGACPTPLQLARWSAGLLPAAEAASLMSHLTACRECSAQLKFLLGDKETELSERAAAALDLHSATAFGRRRLAVRMAARRGVPTSFRIAAAIASIAIAVGSGWYLWRHQRAGATERLIAEAYSAHRPFPYRLPVGGAPSPVRIDRSPSQIASLPEATLATLTKAEEGLARNPADPARLNAAGQARLLANQLRSATEALEDANRSRPRDNSIANSLAVALALRAQSLDDSARERTLSRALRLLDNCIARDPRDSAARFNRALVLQTMGHLRESADELLRCLAMETDGAWRNETASRLTALSAR